MDKPKITAEQLKHYLNTGLKCETVHKTIQGVELTNKVFTLTGIDAEHPRWPFMTYDKEFCLQFGCIGKSFQSNEFKPICFRLSDLHNYMALGDVMGLNSKFLQENIHGFVTGNMRYHYYEELWKHHFWTGPQEYFELGLVIDKMRYSVSEDTHGGRKEAPNG